MSFKLAIFLSATLSLLGCKAIQTNDGGKELSLGAEGKPRIAFDNVGMGWCYYLEDKGYEAKSIKSERTYDVRQVDLDKGTEKIDTHEVIYTRRRYLKRHDLPLSFEIFRAWNDRASATTLEIERAFSKSEFEAYGLLSKEIADARSEVERKLPIEFCSSLNDISELPSFVNNTASSSAKDFVMEQSLRCIGNEGYAVRKTDFEKLSSSQYQNVLSALIGMTTNNAFKKYYQSSKQCRESILQLEVSKGAVLKSRSQKL